MTPAEFAGKIRAADESKLVDLNVSIPARVTAVDGDRVNVIPAINKTRMLEDASKRYETTEEIEGIPVVNLSCGGFSISIPLQAGCQGLLVFCDYDIDNWLNGNPDPHTSRYHDQNDCFFFPAFNGGRNDVDCLEIASSDTKLIICDGGFDFQQGGASFLDDLNGCCPGIAARWKP